MQKTQVFHYLKRCFINLHFYLILAKIILKNMETNSKNYNQSIIKAFTLLDAFTSEKKEWGVRELAINLDTTKAPRIAY
jgi:IclR family KDG regulon transcriptional repressor